MDRRIPCPTCSGGGKSSTRRRDTCWKCHGSGQVADSPKPHVTPPKPKLPKAARAQSRTGLIDGIGKLVALGAAIAAGVWAHGEMPDAPAGWFVAAAVAGALAYALRKLIVIGGVAVGIGMAILNEDSGTGPQQAGVVPAPVARDTPALRVDVVGLCLRNSTEGQLDYTFALPDHQHGNASRIAPGEDRVLWAEERSFDVPPSQVTVFIRNVRLYWTLPIGRTEVAVQDRDIQGEDVACGRRGLPIHEIFRNAGKLRVRQIRG